MRHLWMRCTFGLLLSILLVAPLVGADAPHIIESGDGTPERFLFYDDAVGESGACAQYFHVTSPFTVLSVRVGVSSTGDLGPRTYALQFYTAEPTGPGAFVPGEPLGPLVPFVVEKVPSSPGWAWVSVPLSATRILVSDFFVVLSNDAIGDEEYGLLFDEGGSADPSHLLVRTSLLPAWTPLASVLSGDIGPLYLRIELTSLPSVAASLKPLVSTALLDATSYWGCLSGHLQDREVDGTAAQLLARIDACMQNASTLSNPVFANGELTKAVGYMAELDRLLRLNCRVLSCDARCDGSVMLLSVNDTLYLCLPENPTTGYLWQLSADDGLLVLADTYVPADADGMLVGGGGTRCWEIKAKSRGIFSLHAAYVRPWDPLTPEGTFEMTIKVD
ncbi:MAG: protease inhibitor I42 family protein [Candidatus Methanofastidiosa archaeon]|nr:protease inhibitor I42 family protein [Candidatus Methanofastidiosa archaeon]